MDPVGTGGDGANTINISTTAAIIARAAGAKVVKHGAERLPQSRAQLTSWRPWGSISTSMGLKLLPAFDEIGYRFLFRP